MPTSNERSENVVEHFKKNRDQIPGTKKRIKNRKVRDFIRGTADIEENRHRAHRGE